MPHQRGSGVAKPSPEVLAKFADGPSLEEVCRNAKIVHEVCELLGIEFRGFRHLDALLEGAIRTEVDLVDLIEDPDDRPYIWDLED